MKKTLAGVASIALTVSSASAYNITLVNITANDATAVPILDNSGTPIAVGAGFAAAGTFSEFPSGIDTIASSFQQFGSGSTTFNVGPGFANNAGSESIPPDSDDPRIGQSVYVVFGNGLTLEESNEFAIIDTGSVMGREDNQGAGGVSVLLISSNLEADDVTFGSVDTNYDYPGLGPVNEAIRLGDGTVVPEPSTSLLAALAGLALAARRRR